jgi:hypothetical protein
MESFRERFGTTAHQGDSIAGVDEGERYGPAYA